MAWSVVGRLRAFSGFLFLAAPLLLSPVAAGASGSVRTWGSDTYGQLGNDSLTGSSIPVSVSGLTGLTAVAAGGRHSLVLKSDGTVWAWGDNDHGQLGINSTSNTTVPVQVQDSTGASFLTGVTAIAAGYYHSLASKSNGTVWAWGDNYYGELGNGTSKNVSVPVQVKDSSGVSYLTGIIAVAAAQEHSLALKSDGTVWAWGDNAYGELGDADPNFLESSVPVQVRDSTGTSYLTGVVAIAAGYADNLALKNDGTVWAWGRGDMGQLGNDSTGNSSVPVQVKDPTGTSYLSGVTAVASGAFHNLALKGGGTVWGWGNNADGELGINSGGVFGAYSSLPLQVKDPTGASFLMGISAIAGGYYHSLAAKSDGSAWAWGGNSAGQLGNDTTAASKLPVQVGGIVGCVAVAGGALHSLAVIGNPVPSVSITSSQNPSAVGLPITFTAAVTSAAAGMPTGTVTFLDGTTTLGAQVLVNGQAVFSTSSLSSGAHTITVSYSGDSTFSAGQSSLAQVVWDAWLPADISVGSDNRSRVLWMNPDGRAVLWSLDRTTGNYTQGPVFGPYDGGAWQASRIACGKDGISHVLWTKRDGTLSLWWLGADNTFQKNMIYGPFAGWIATDIAVGTDNLTRILWTNVNDGRAIVWSVDGNGAASNNTNFYGPYSGYTAMALACGSDGLTRLAWANTLGIASVWIMNEKNQEQSFFIYGPYTGWIPTDIDVGSDNLARVLWTNTVDGRAIVWSVDANGNRSDDQNFYGPFTGYTAQHLSCGSDGFTRLTWLRGDGVLSLWHLAADNTMLTFNVYGPYF